MTELVYFTGPMGRKSTLALRLDYTHTAGGRKGRPFTSQAGAAAIRAAEVVGDEL